MLIYELRVEYIGNPNITERDYFSTEKLARIHAKEEIFVHTILNIDEIELDTLGRETVYTSYWPHTPLHTDNYTDDMWKCKICRAHLYSLVKASPSLTNLILGNFRRHVVATHMKKEE